MCVCVCVCAWVRACARDTLYTPTLQVYSISVGGLQMKTRYYYRVVSTNSAGSTQSELATFNTTGVGECVCVCVCVWVCVGVWVCGCVCSRFLTSTKSHSLVVCVCTCAYCSTVVYAALTTIHCRSECSPLPELHYDHTH